MTERSAPSVCLCVPTFRRPEGLRKLLNHIERLNYAGSLRIVVVDNDAEARAGAAVVEEVSPTFRFPIRSYIEPRRGHTYAYDQAFVRACRSDPAPEFVAVLDDDEYPDPNWLTEMIRIAHQHSTSRSLVVRCFPSSTRRITGWRKAASIRRIDTKPDRCR